MKNWIWKVSLSVAFTILVIVAYSGRLIFSGDFASLKENVKFILERNLSLDQVPFDEKQTIKSKDSPQGSSRDDRIRLNVLSIEGRKGVSNVRNWSRWEREDPVNESVEGIQKILSRINYTDAEWSKKVDICFTYGSRKTPVRDALKIERGCKRRIPAALVAGVKKCGTGTLSRFLDLHPAVSMSREVVFPEEKVTGDSITHWIQLMPLSSPYQITMTENPAFFSYPDDWFLDFKTYLSTDTKFLVILRDPVDRAISDYIHRVAHSDAPRDRPFDMVLKSVRILDTFEKTILTPNGDIVPSKIILQGRYVVSVEEILEVYSRDQFLFIDGDDFAKDPFPIMVKVEAFLGLPKFYKQSHFVKNKTKGFYCAQVPERPDFRCMIPSKGRPHPKVSEDVLRKLRDFYRPYNRALVDQLGLNFSWIYK